MINLFFISLALVWDLPASPNSKTEILAPGSCSPLFRKLLQQDRAGSFSATYHLNAEFFPVDKNGVEIQTVKKTGVKDYLRQITRLVDASLVGYHSHLEKDAEESPFLLEKIRMIVHGSALAHKEFLRLLNRRSLFATYQFEIESVDLSGGR